MWKVCWLRRNRVLSTSDLRTILLRYLCLYAPLIPTCTDIVHHLLFVMPAPTSILHVGSIPFRTSKVEVLLPVIQTLLPTKTSSTAVIEELIVVKSTSKEPSARLYCTKVSRSSQRISSSDGQSETNPSFWDSTSFGQPNENQTKSLLIF